MSVLDKFGKAAMDALGKAARAADGVKQRVEPLIERSELASKIRDRVVGRSEENEDDVPAPERLRSPFAASPSESKEPEKPLANPEIPAQIYGMGTDPWTGRALQRLEDRDVVHDFVDLEAEGGIAIETRLLRETQQGKGPFVYLRGEFIGGFNALDEIDRLGQLDEMIKTPEERAKSSTRTRIVIAKRDDGDDIPGERGRG